MSLKAVLFPLGCIIAWFVLLPALVIGGGIALFVYATLAELGAFLTGSAARTLDTAAARVMARQMCGGGYGVNAVGSRNDFT